MTIFGINSSFMTIFGINSSFMTIIGTQSTNSLSNLYSQYLLGSIYQIIMTNKRMI